MSKPDVIGLAEPISKQRLRLWLQTLKVTRFLGNEVRERLRLEFGSTLPRFDVLAMLDRSRKGLKMSQLSQQLMVSNGNITGIVDRLVADGLVVRAPVSGDKRATLVRLTAKGTRTFAAMAARHEAWVDELLVELDEREILGMITTCAKIRKDEA